MARSAPVIFFFFLTSLFGAAAHAQTFDAAGTLTLDGQTWNSTDLELGGSSGSVSEDFSGLSGSAGSYADFTVFDEPEAINAGPSNWHIDTNDQLKQSSNIWGPHFTTTAFDEPGTFLKWNPGTTSGDLNVSLDYFNSDNDNGGFAFRFTDLDNMYLFDSDRQDYNARLYKKENGVVSVLAQKAGYLAQNAWHDLELKVEGDDIQIWANGSLYLQASDHSLTGGHFAFFNSGSQSTHYDNVNLAWEQHQALNIVNGSTVANTGDMTIHSGSTLTLSDASSTLQLDGSFTNNGTFDFEGGTLRLDGPGASWDPGSFNFQPDTDATLEVVGGASVSNVPSLGSHMTVYDNAKIEVKSGSSLAARHQFRIDDGGDTLVDGEGSTLTVTDAGTNYSGRLYVGYTTGGRGTMTVSGGADVTVENGVHVAYYSSDYIGAGSSGADALQVDVDGDDMADGSQLTIFGAGSTVTTGDGSSDGWVYVGSGGENARLYIEDGGALSTGSLTISTWLDTDEGGISASGSGDGGYVKVTGAGSAANVSGGVEVGRDGYNGRLDVLSGGSVTTGTDLSVGKSATSIGNSVLVSGASEGSDATLSVGGGFYLGGTSAGAGGSGTATIESGGVLAVDGATQVYSGNTMTLSGGELQLGGAFTNNGTFDWQSGSILLDGADADWNSSNIISIGQSATASLTVQNDGRVTNSSSLFVGRYGTGTMNIQSGGDVSNGAGVVGREFGGSGTVTVTGAESIWSNAPLTVGYSGEGILRIEDGGNVNSSIGLLGHAPGSSGTATIEGAGSRWDNSGDLYIGGSPSSSGGSSAVSVLDGGTLSVGGETKIYSGSTLTLGTSTFASGGITMEGGTIAASAAAGEAGALHSSEVGTISGHGSISAPVHLGEGGQVRGSGGMLALSGDVTGTGTLADLEFDGDITLGNSAGTVTLEDVVVASTSVFHFEILGTDPGEHDQLVLLGDVTLGGTAIITIAAGLLPVYGQTFNLVDGSGATNVAGAFSSIQFDESNYSWSFDGTSGALTFVPEPGTGLLVLLGLAGLGMRRRRAH